jgi:hypothetical protein
MCKGFIPHIEIQMPSWAPGRAEMYGPQTKFRYWVYSLYFTTYGYEYEDGNDHGPETTQRLLDMGFSNLHQYWKGQDELSRHLAQRTERLNANV